jgi:hypothetical protein
MSEVILSPGVFQIESDQSLYTQAPPALGAAIVGPTVGGRPFVPTYVTTYTQYLSLFGDIFKSGSYYYEYFTSQAAREYFNNGGQSLLVTRIISGSAGIDTYAQASVPSSISSTAGIRASASFVANGNDTGSAGSSKILQLGIPGVNDYLIFTTLNTNWLAAGQSIYDSTADYAYIGIGATPTLDDWGHAITASINGSSSFFDNRFTASYSTSTKRLTVTALVPSNQNESVNNNWFVSRSLFNPGDTLGTVQLFDNGDDGTVDSSFVLETLAWGTQMNNTSSLTLGALASGSAQNVRWEVTNVNSGSNGGTFTVVVRRGDDNDNLKNILETWANVSLDPQLPNYISRVIGDLKPKYNITTGRVDFEGTYTNVSQYVRVASVTTPNVDSLDNNGNFKTGSYALTLPQIGSGSYGGSFAGGVADTNLPKNMNENITAANIQGFTADDYNRAFTMLSNKDEYQFNVLMAPGVGLDTAAADNMIATCEGRGDAIAIVDNGVYTNATVNGAVQNAAGANSNYAATYFPWVQLFSSNLGKTVWCPPSTVIGGVLAFNDQVSAEWFAPAGLNRGGIPSVIRAQFRLSQTDRDTLYTGNVNPLATFPGTGVCVWGQKTLQRKQTSLDRVNVRRLLIALKDFIGGVARNLVFEQNTAVTRNRFLSQVNPYLESVTQRQGLFAYRVVMDDTNNTPDVIDRNQLVGQIFIQPTKTAEFIILNFNLTPTGATFPA